MILAQLIVSSPALAADRSSGVDLRPAMRELQRASVLNQKFAELGIGC
jgi:hypothetical protein